MCRVKEFDVFYFDRFCFDRETLIGYFYYSFDEKELFEEEIDFNNGSFDIKDDTEINSFLFQIHIAL
jgi:hypothetical protein